jgi:hypothetical protein
MRFKHAILLPLFLCGAFLFRMYALGFALTQPASATHMRVPGVNVKSLDNQARRRALKLHVKETGSRLLAAKFYKKGKAVRCQRWRPSAWRFAKILPMFTDALACKSAGKAFAPERRTHTGAHRLFLALSVIRI